MLMKAQTLGTLSKKYLIQSRLSVILDMLKCAQFQKL